MYRVRTSAFYRTYETDEEQYETSDGVFAYCLLSMVRVDRAHTGKTSDELPDRVEDAYTSE